MDFDVPHEIRDYLDELDAFTEAEILPLERAHPEFFDHRREHARTDWDAGGLPRPEWEALLAEMRRRADAGGHLRYGLPRELGGRGASNLAMALVREHLARRGPGLHNDLQNESSIVGNFPLVHAIHAFGTEEQKQNYLEALITGEHRIAFGLTEPAHGSDALHLETRAVRDDDHFVLNGSKRFNTGLHTATVDLVFARTSGRPGEPRGITAFLVPTDAPGFSVDFFWSTFNMPTDHAEATLRDVRVPASSILGREGEGMAVAQHFVHENRIRQAASSLGAAGYCIERAMAYTRERRTFGRPLAENQAIHFPLAELATEAEMVRGLVARAAWLLDRRDPLEVTELVSMAYLRANRLRCEAADRAMQVHGGLGYTRHLSYEHIYRHHRRYRITEGSDEIQLRRIAGRLFGFSGRRAPGFARPAPPGPGPGGRPPRAPIPNRACEPEPPGALPRLHRPPRWGCPAWVSRPGGHGARAPGGEPPRPAPWRARRGLGRDGVGRFGVARDRNPTLAGLRALVAAVGRCAAEGA